MPSLQESLRQFFAVLEDFLHTTLTNESLGKPAEKERSKVTALLKKLYTDHDEVCPPKAKRVSTAKIPAKDHNRESSVSPATSSLGASGSDSSGRLTQGPDEIAPTTVKALANPTKIGFLQMKTSGTKQKPYCVLHKNILYWFVKPSDRQQEGAIFATDYELKVDEKKIAKKNFTFELVGPGKKPYQFVADTKEDLDSWITAFAIRHKSDDDDGKIDEEKRKALARRQLPKPPSDPNDPNDPYDMEEDIAYSTYTSSASEKTAVYINDNAIKASNASTDKTDTDREEDVYEILDGCPPSTSELTSFFNNLLKPKK